MRKSSTYNDPLISGRRQDVMLFIFIINRDTDKILPRGTPTSSGFGSEYVLPISVLKDRSSRKFWMKMGSLPCNPKFLRSLRIPYGHVVS